MLLKLKTGSPRRPTAKLQLAFLISWFFFACTGGDCVIIASDDDLKKMRSYDHLYSSSLTIQGEVTCSPPFNARFLPRATLSLRFSRDDSRIAIVGTKLSIEDKFALPVRDPKKPSYDGVTYDKNGTPSIYVVDGFACSFEPDRSAIANIETCYEVVDKNLKEVKEGGARLITISPPDSQLLAIRVNTIVWSLGRGFSEAIRDVVSSEEMGSGIVRIVANGTYGEKIDGVWEMEVDRVNQHLVRKATFKRGGLNGDVAVSMHNSGLSRQGECTYPSAALCGIFGDSREYKFSDVRFKTDSNLFDEARKLVDDRSVNNISISDYRFVPPKTEVIDRPKLPANKTVNNDLARKIAAAKPLTRQFWFIAVNALLFIFSLIVLAFYKSKKQGKIYSDNHNSK